MDKEQVIKLVEDEEEFYGPMPECVFQNIKEVVEANDMHGLEELLRMTVRIVKRNIVERINQNWKD